MLHLHHGILLCYKKELNLIICNKIYATKYSMLSETSQAQKCKYLAFSDMSINREDTKMCKNREFQPLLIHLWNCGLSSFYLLNIMISGE